MIVYVTLTLIQHLLYWYHIYIKELENGILAKNQEGILQESPFHTIISE